MRNLEFKTNAGGIERNLVCFWWSKILITASPLKKTYLSKYIYSIKL